MQGGTGVSCTVPSYCGYNRMKTSVLCNQLRFHNLTDKAALWDRDRLFE